MLRHFEVYMPTYGGKILHVKIDGLEKNYPQPFGRYRYLITQELQGRMNARPANLIRPALHLSGRGIFRNIIQEINSIRVKSQQFFERSRALPKNRFESPEHICDEMRHAV